MKTAMLDKPKRITSNLDIEVRCDNDGVWLGFFAKDGKVALVNLDKITDSLPVDSISKAALKSWAADRREQGIA